MIEKIQYKLENYEKALARLRDAISLPMDDSIIVDGIIQRFEFTYELGWKLMKSYLEYEGVTEATTPRSTFREAYVAGIIEESDKWLSMIADRNRTSHTYDEEMALQVCQRVKAEHINILEQLLTTMKEKMR
ncbi:nucleotidyltransferase [Bacillus cereus]|uniref:nucleotidyltransferase substrate binding protein n=1 Tax=Bacillus cereus TaxID=1396 RepID=UPI000BEB46DD|nr:nucleotidyltransferase substrate binding protein [Bacillus cereus]PEE32424.1 nucleotidyltransferase [Bacillus cereus]PET45258.1 nucleotidyltransferase [Bacillus cereus]PEV66258.1 nucleotidyltransferase [Bacillus cereus]PFA36687.1 nucleotidyltransferase [Bacillus cereus]PFD81124.1 nucleotidyltransferase [Bacillus cereus]